MNVKDSAIRKQTTNSWEIKLKRLLNEILTGKQTVVTLTVRLWHSLPKLPYILEELEETPDHSTTNWGVRLHLEILAEPTLVGSIYYIIFQELWLTEWQTHLVVKLAANIRNNRLKYVNCIFEQWFGVANSILQLQISLPRQVTFQSIIYPSLRCNTALGQRWASRTSMR